MVHIPFTLRARELPAESDRSQSMSRAFLWNFVGVLLYNLGQGVILVGIARALSVEAVGQYALALAIAAPVYLTIGLNLRLARATDAHDSWPWPAYIRLRSLLNMFSFTVTLILGILFQLGAEGLLVVGLVAVSKGFEASSQLVYGHCQLAERMDLVARSLILRGVGGAGLLLAVLTLTQSLPTAIAAQTVAWAVIYLVNDRPLGHRLQSQATPRKQRATSGQVWSLLRVATPLGVDAGVSSFAISVPRFVVHMTLGSGALGLYAPLAYLAQLVSLTTGALGDVVISRLSRFHVSNQRRAFWKTMTVVIIFGWVVTAGAVGGAALLGEPLLRWALGPEYANQDVLLVLLIGAGFMTFEQTLARALYAARRYKAVAWVNFCILVASISLAIALIPSWGLVGAAATQGAAFALGTLLTAAYILRPQTKKVTPS